MKGNKLTQTPRVQKVPDGALTLYVSVVQSL